MKELEKEVLLMVLDRIGLEDIDPESFDYDAPIFATEDAEGTGLGLDSVDALEIVVGLREKYGIKVTEDDRGIFTSIRSVAKFVEEKKA